MLTEEQAKEKWCPMVRCAPGGDNANADGGGRRDRYCIASRCMMWRAVETAEFKSRAEAEFRKSGRRLYADSGYCGLAGNPALSARDGSA